MSVVLLCQLFVCLLCVAACAGGGFYVYSKGTSLAALLNPITALTSIGTKLASLSKTRGAGKVMQCSADEDYDAGLCYPKCAAGYTGVGPVCYQGCPNGYTNNGLFCAKPASYGRGTGYALWNEDKCKSENPQGCEKNGLLWYPNCAKNFHAVGCCVCSPDCPDGMNDIGVSCAKKTYGRGVGKPIHACPAGQELEAGLCYPPCPPGFRGVGPVCWKQS